MNKTYCVYIITNINETVLYTGYTQDIQKRMREHKIGEFSNSFSKRYNLKRLIYFALHLTHQSARHREFLIKKWKREWKENLIKSKNPAWRDLSDENGEIDEETFTLFLAE